jgi:hypothetical protein
MNRLSRVLSAGLLCLAAAGQSAGAATITPEGHRLEASLDALDVEQHWPAGVHVDWRTGEPDGREVKTEGKHTHCSAFVAAAAEKLGVYILRPPEHSPVLLANAQSDWMSDAAVAQGWHPLANGLQAQSDANQGLLVVAVYRNHHDDRPGHIAIVRPSDKSDTALRDEGPQITQAGMTNYRSTSLMQGFASHPAAWNRGEVRYYAHPVDWQSLPK